MRRVLLVLAAVVVAVGVGAWVSGALGGDGDREAYCERIAAIPDVAEVLSSLDASDPGGVEHRIQEAVDAYAALEDDAPSSIEDDVARLRRGVEVVLEAVRENPGDLPAARQAILAHEDQVAGLAAAGTRVADDARIECSVDLDRG